MISKKKLFEKREYIGFLGNFQQKIKHMSVNYCINEARIRKGGHFCYKTG